MNTPPLRKFGSELTKLKKVNYKNIKLGKFYYIRVRNKDNGSNIWGFKQDFIGKITNINDTGVSFDFLYVRNADPRHGASTWKKASDYNRVLILTESLKRKNLNDNTTFYIDESQSSVNTTRKGIRRLFGIFKTIKSTRRGTLKS